MGPCLYMVWNKKKKFLCFCLQECVCFNGSSNYYFFFFNVVDFWWSYSTIFLCFLHVTCLYINFKLYFLSMSILYPIGVNHLIKLLIRTESLSRSCSHSWSECPRRRPRSSCFTHPWSSWSCSCSSSSSSSRGQPETIHSSNEFIQKNKRRGGDSNPWPLAL